MPNNIYRVDNGNTHGWLVRFEHGGRVLTKTFTDRVHGGRDLTLAKAERYRDAMRESIGRPLPSTKQIHTRESRRKAWKRRTRTRVPGIGYTFGRHRGGSVSLSVQGFWRDPDGSWKSIKRSTDRHGIEGALMQVCRPVARGLATGPAFGGRKRHLTAQALFDAALPVIREIHERRKWAA